MGVRDMRVADDAYFRTLLTAEVVHVSGYRIRNTFSRLHIFLTDSGHFFFFFTRFAFYATMLTN